MLSDRQTDTQSQIVLPNILFYAIANDKISAKKKNKRKKCDIFMWKYFLFLRVYPWNKLINLGDYIIKFKLTGLLGKASTTFKALRHTTKLLSKSASTNLHDILILLILAIFQTLSSFFPLHPARLKLYSLSLISMWLSRGYCLLSRGNLASVGNS